MYTVSELFYYFICVYIHLFIIYHYKFSISLKTAVHVESFLCLFSFILSGFDNNRLPEQSNLTICPLHLVPSTFAVQNPMSDSFPLQFNSDSKTGYLSTDIAVALPVVFLKHCNINKKKSNSSTYNGHNFKEETPFPCINQYKSVDIVFQWACGCHRWYLFLFQYGVLIVNNYKT